MLYAVNTGILCRSPKVGSLQQPQTCLWVVIFQVGGIRHSREEWDFHLWHQCVVDGHVGQAQPIRRPPVGDVALQDLLCKTKQCSQVCQGGERAIRHFSTKNRVALIH